MVTSLMYQPRRRLSLLLIDRGAGNSHRTPNNTLELVSQSEAAQQIHDLFRSDYSGIRRQHQLFHL